MDEGTLEELVRQRLRPVDVQHAVVNLVLELFASMGEGPAPFYADFEEVE